MGRRLLPITNVTPKVMVPILGKPFLAWKLEGLARQGATEIFLLLGLGSEQVIDFLATYRTPLKIHVLTDGDLLLGTAGAIRKNLEYLPDVFILTFGDNLLDFNLEELSEVYSRENKSIMVCTTYKEPEQNFNVRLQGSFIEKYDKDNNLDCFLMDYGYSVFELNSFKDLELDQVLDLRIIIDQLIHTQQLLALTTNKEYFEVGTIAGLERTTSWLIQNTR